MTICGSKNTDSQTLCLLQNFHFQEQILPPLSPKPAGCCLTQKRYYTDLSYHHQKALHPHSLKMPILTFEIHQICPFSISLLHPNCTCHSLSPLGSVVILLLCPSLRTVSITPTPSSNVTQVRKPSQSPKILWYRFHSPNYAARPLRGRL